MSYFRPGPPQPDPGHDAHWNRGAYLAESRAACSACHTARNALGAEQVGHPYGGALFAGWIATPLDISPSPARWSEAEIFAYLRTGESPPHGVAVGPMRLVVKGLAKLPDSDLKAIAAYLVSLNRPSRAAPDIARAMAPHPPANPREHPGLTIYRANCAGCHDPGGTARSPLGLNASLWLQGKPPKFIPPVLGGTHATEGPPRAVPRLSAKRTDDDLAPLAPSLWIS